jgi:hypothetical protein
MAEISIFIIEYILLCVVQECKKKPRSQNVCVFSFEGLDFLFTSIAIKCNDRIEYRVAIAKDGARRLSSTLGNA